jgi:hypothetical protein
MLTSDVVEAFKVVFRRIRWEELRMFDVLVEIRTGQPLNKGTVLPV